MQYAHPVATGYTFCFHWNSKFAQAQRKRAAPTAANYAITVPGRGKVIHVYVAEDYITARHAAHEVCGHGLQIRDMGDVDYLATYGWHFILRAGSHTKHMMEKQAQSREPTYVHLFVPRFTRLMEIAGLSPLVLENAT
jgi:hypothetical protein